MSEPVAPDPHGHVGAEIEVPHLEVDETVPPRPEEEVADVARQVPRGPDGEPLLTS
ncbi:MULTISPECIES: hypothetical protein [unclassified Actinotalea]|uniref:hypothetical protein n=1 Tax=unclassified Actinotalea TaxID=2638618 RepID=UPI0015F5CB05|nr:MULTISPECIES: hypothetical protein [unclassified Actinotalea]